MRPNNPIKLQLKKDRGHSITLLGGISNEWADCKYIQADKTSSENVVKWLEHIRPFIAPTGAVVILDNHKSHKSKLVTELAHEMNLELIYIPPTCSVSMTIAFMTIFLKEMNPVECTWGNFKGHWRRLLYDPQLGVTTANAQAYVHQAMSMVNAKPKSLGKRFYEELLRYPP